MNVRISSSLAVALLTALATPACSAPEKSPTDNGGTRSDTNGGRRGGGDSSQGPVAETPSTSSPAPEPTDPAETSNFLDPPVVNTGFIAGGAQTFQVPLWTDIKGQLTWTVADPTIADIKPVDPPSDYLEAKKENPKLGDFFFAMLTTKKAGTTKISVSGGGKTAQSDLTVKEYTTAAYTAGQTRYKTGEGTAERRPCAGCHEKPDGVDHSPTWVSILNDDQVLSGVQTGSVTFGNQKFELNGGNHKWNLTEEEKTGIVTFLRALPPKTFK